MHDWPDVSIHIKETEIKISTDHSGVASIKFTLSGTQFLPAAEPVVNPTKIKIDACGRSVMIFGEEAVSEEMQRQIESVLTPSFKPEELSDVHFDINHPSLHDDDCDWHDCVYYEPRKTHPLNTLQSPVTSHTAGTPPCGSQWIELAPIPSAQLSSIFCCFDGLLHLHFDADSLIYFAEFYLYGD